MARSRNIKPGFFLNDRLADLDMAARLLFAGLWCVADREGRLEDNVKKIKIQVLPYDEVDIDKLLNDLVKSDFITRYSVDGIGYIQVSNFGKHQNPHKREAASVIPPAPEKHGAGTMLAPEKHRTSPADSLNLIPDSLNLIPDSLNLIPDSASGEKVNASAEKSCLDDGAQVEPDTEPGKGINYTEEFELFWSAYPRHKEKQTAFRCWRARLKEGTQPRELITAAGLYADEVRRLKTQEEFIKQAKTFLGPNRPYLDYTGKVVNISDRYRTDDYTG